MSAQDTLTRRYGAPSVARHRLVVAGSALLVAVFLTWLVWAIWLNSNPKVTSELQRFSVTDDHQVTAVVAVHLSDDSVRAACQVRALAEDHSVVGEVTLRPDPSKGELQGVTIRTDRRATSVESLGCTAPGQDKPR